MILFPTSYRSAGRKAAAVCSCFLCAVFLISLLSFNSSAFDSLPSMTKAFIHDGTSVNLVADAVLNSQTGLYSITTSQPLYNYQPSRDFYCLGTMFIPGSGESYDSSSKFQYTISLVLSAGNSFKTTDPTAYGLFHTSLDSSGSPIVADASYITYEPDIIVDSSVYTFSFNDISYQSIANARLIYMQTSYDNVTTYTINDNGLPKAEVTLLNVFFGLTSDFDQDAYNKEVINKLDSIDRELGKTNEKLDNIQGSLDDVGDKVDGVGDKVDEVGDQISGEIDDLENVIVTQAQEEMDIADEKGNEASGEANDALSDSGLTPDLGNIWIGLMTLFDSISTTDTVSYIPIPEVKLPSLSTPAGSTPELVLIEEQNYDISPILYNDNIQKLISAAKVLYYIFFAIFIVDYCRKLLSKIGLGDVNTNDNASAQTDPSRKDSSASKSDPHGVKSR